MKFCIDTRSGPSWNSFCGKLARVEYYPPVTNIRSLVYYLNVYNQDSVEEWCEDCVNDPRLTLIILENLDL